MGWCPSAVILNISLKWQWFSHNATFSPGVSLSQRCSSGVDISRDRVVLFKQLHSVPLTFVLAHSQMAIVKPSHILLLQSDNISWSSWGRFQSNPHRGHENMNSIYDLAVSINHCHSHSEILVYWPWKQQETIPEKITSQYQQSLLAFTELTANLWLNNIQLRRVTILWGMSTSKTARLQTQVVSNGPMADGTRLTKSWIRLQHIHFRPLKLVPEPAWKFWLKFLKCIQAMALQALATVDFKVNILTCHRAVYAKVLTVC